MSLYHAWLLCPARLPALAWHPAAVRAATYRQGMAGPGAQEKVPLPTAKPPLLHVAQVVTVCLALAPDNLLPRPGDGARRDRRGRLQVLARSSEARGGRTHDPVALPRRWVGRPGPMESMAAAALDYSGVRGTGAPTRVATTLADGRRELQPAGGLISIVVTMLVPTGQIPATGWRWLPIEHLDEELPSWDVLAAQASRPAARELLRDADVAVQLLPEQFGLRDLRRVFEAHWDTKLDPSNFSRLALAKGSGFLTPVGEDASRPGKPTVLYRHGHGPAPRLAPG